MNKKEKLLVFQLIVCGICALLAGVYINSTIIKYQTNGNWPGECLIAVIWSLAAIIGGVRVYLISHKNYQTSKNKKQ
ncbi:phosphotransferase system glucose/maltose/N-acetylglucosamine-specific IIC component [Lactobacillus colini]|uniref:Phosphotransferase system glucose/maltose/N-acetylglucosamine-specific IIC component n=1 Tax=Lactobacillus colini TaxID=1819254 RepID=A0ABS4MFG8_9LACO|nr:hypothetical protein [Lactobacillus colini]MBP2058081.1 phosphotransferase system glucose/maltose/N-acetylglucosamine-specific IIC component [Lactobacillus colini]